MPLHLLATSYCDVASEERGLVDAPVHLRPKVPEPTSPVLSIHGLLEEQNAELHQKYGVLNGLLHRNSHILLTGCFTVIQVT